MSSGASTPIKDSNKTSEQRLQPSPIQANTKEDSGDDEAAEEDEEMDSFLKQAGGHHQPDADRDAIRQLLDSFTPDQLHRYEAFRRAKFGKMGIKKTISAVTDHHVPHSATIVVAGVAKVFVGEITEMALDVMEEWGESGAIRPSHLREAFRRYRSVRKRIPNRLYKKDILE